MLVSTRFLIAFIIFSGNIDYDICIDIFKQHSSTQFWYFRRTVESRPGEGDRESLFVSFPSKAKPAMISGAALGQRTDISLQIQIQIQTRPVTRLYSFLAH